MMRFLTTIVAAASAVSATYDYGQGQGQGGAYTTSTVAATNTVAANNLNAASVTSSSSLEAAATAWPSSSLSTTVTTIVKTVSGVATTETQTLTQAAIATGSGNVNVLAASGSSSGGPTSTVTVGASASLLFSPNNFKADKGVTIEFQFLPANHSVTQSTFAKPCEALDKGITSGFRPTTGAGVPNTTVFRITIDDATKPLWFFCGQPTKTHCKAGMVLAINAPDTGNNFASYSALATAATTLINPAVNSAVGGTLAQANACAVVSTTMTSSTLTSSSTTTSSSATKSGVGANGAGATNTSSTVGPSGTGLQSTGPGNELVVNGGVLGVALVFALGML